MILIDSHCHLDRLDLTSFDNRLSLVLDEAYKKNVKYFLCVCINLDHVDSILAIAEKYTNVFASVGIHPTEAVSTDLIGQKLAELARHPKVVALGETGLDYYRNDHDKDRQQECFRKHIQIAKQVKKPLIVHTRYARQDTIRLLQEEQAEEVGGVMHCFTEDLATAEKALALNFYISFSGIVTFKNATDLQQLAKQIPLDRLLIETDAPYLAPVPYRGKPNQPAYVYYVAECIANLRGLTITELANQTTVNFFTLFKQAVS